MLGLNKQSIVDRLLPMGITPSQERVEDIFAHTNIALCKYWGKRNTELHLPQNSSLSISLDHLGCWTTLAFIDAPCDEIYLAGQPLDSHHSFYKQVSAYLDLFRGPHRYHFFLETRANIPLSAGLASSAAGYAALVKALDTLFGWRLPDASLSILARLGSGSAARSLWPGFVMWKRGEQTDGMDSVASPIPVDWPEFRIGLLMIADTPKAVSSRAGMQRTVETAPLYSIWPSKAEADFVRMLEAVKAKDFLTVAELAEHNALLMHATMQNACPPINYWQPNTMTCMQQVWSCRQSGIPVYFTMDAGPNLKLLFPSSSKAAVLEAFPQMHLSN